MLLYIAELEPLQDSMIIITCPDAVDIYHQSTVV